MLFAYMFFCLFFVLIISIIVYTRTHAQFGGKITPLEISRLSRSKQWNGKIFLNRAPINMSMGPLKVVNIMFQSFKNRKVRMPKNLIFVKPSYIDISPNILILSSRWLDINNCAKSRI